MRRIRREVEGLGDQVVGAELQLLARIGGGHLVADLGLGQRGDLVHAGQLHRLGDLRRAAVQRAAEDVREAQHVVDLVRVVRAAGGDDAVGPRRLGQFGPDLRLGVGQRQDDGLVGHALDHLRRHHAGGRAAQEHVGALAPRRPACAPRSSGSSAASIRRACRRGLRAPRPCESQTKMFAALDAQADHQVQAGDGRRAGAGDGDLHLADVLAHQFQAVEQRRGRDDGGAVLVVVEDRDVQPLAQLLLDVEALRRLDVLEVDAAQRGLQRGDDVDQLVRVALGQFDVEHVDAGELLEQATLAFHHRLAGQRADVAQAQHRGAVGDHAHQVAARGVFGGQRSGPPRSPGRHRPRRANRPATGRAGWTAAWSARPRSCRAPAAVVFERGFAQGFFGGGQRGIHRRSFGWVGTPKVTPD